MVKVAITIDTEEDLWCEYSAAPGPALNTGSIPLVQNIFDQYGALPTYLVSYSVMLDEPAVHILRGIQERNRCELGTHCHPWNTPPHDEEINERNTMLCNLREDVVRNKLELLHKTFVARFGVTPLSFRAGRWGFGPAVAKGIEDLGYRVDSSVTPLVDWSVYQGPDFWRAPRHPYRLSPASILSAGEEGDVLEAPPTTGFFQRSPALCAAILRPFLRSEYLKKLRVVGLMDRARIINLRWLSPELSSGKDMISLAESLVRSGASFLNMCFHSTSLFPGKSPFVRSEADLGNFLRRIRTFIEHASRAGWQFTTLKEISADY